MVAHHNTPCVWSSDGLVMNGRPGGLTWTRELRSERMHAKGSAHDHSLLLHLSSDY